jgi:diguanylate cyclase (GGDEF)-like protein/PAS domain S-box-containing protein
MRKNELQLAAQLLDLNPVGALLLDARRKDLPVVCVNQALVELTGFSAAEMLEQPWRRFSAGACAPVTESMQHTLRDADQTAPATRVLSRNHQGSNDGVQLNFSPLFDVKGLLSGWYATIADVPVSGFSALPSANASDEASAAFRKRAGRDAATGLLNQASFAAALQREWLHGSRDQRELSAIVVRVDSFTEYLDVFGQHAGDACLRKVGTAISGSLRRSGDICARLDDDSFVVLLAATSPKNARAVAERIAEKVRGLAVHHPRSRLARFITVSYGVAGIMPDWQESATMLVDDARAALTQMPPSSVLSA